MSIDVNTTFDNVFKSPTADFTTVLMVFVPRRNPRVFDCLHHVTDSGPAIPNKRHCLGTACLELSVRMMGQEDDVGSVNSYG